MLIPQNSLQIVKALDWFSTTDLWNTEILSTQNYILMPYLAFAFPVWHLIFAGYTWPKINYPNASYEVGFMTNSTPLDFF